MAVLDDTDWSYFLTTAPTLAISILDHLRWSNFALINQDPFAPVPVEVSADKWTI